MLALEHFSSLTDGGLLLAVKLVMQFKIILMLSFMQNPSNFKFFVVGTRKIVKQHCSY